MLLFFSVVAIAAQADTTTVNVPQGSVRDFSPDATITSLVKQGAGTLNLLTTGNLTSLRAEGGLVRVLPEVSGGTLAVTVDGAALQLGASAKLASLELLNGAQVQVLPSEGAIILETDPLTVDLSSGSRLDLADNTLIMPYSGTSPRPRDSGAAGGDDRGLPWTGPGISSSVAAADSVTGASALGYLDNAFFEFPEYPPGHPIPTQCVFVSYTTCGDANFDYLVDGGDTGLFDLGLAGRVFWVGLWGPELRRRNGRLRLRFSRLRGRVW